MKKIMLWGAVGVFAIVLSVAFAMHAIALGRALLGTVKEPTALGRYEEVRDLYFQVAHWAASAACYARLRYTDTLEAHDKNDDDQSICLISAIGARFMYGADAAVKRWAQLKLGERSPG